MRQGNHYCLDFNSQSQAEKQKILEFMNNNKVLLVKANDNQQMEVNVKIKNIKKNGLNHSFSQINGGILKNQRNSTPKFINEQNDQQMHNQRSNQTPKKYHNYELAQQQHTQRQSNNRVTFEPLSQDQQKTPTHKHHHLDQCNQMILQNPSYCGDSKSCLHKHNYCLACNVLDKYYLKNSLCEGRQLNQSVPKLVQSPKQCNKTYNIDIPDVIIIDNTNQKKNKRNQTKRDNFHKQQNHSAIDLLNSNNIKSNYNNKFDINDYQLSHNLQNTNNSTNNLNKITSKSNSPAQKCKYNQFSQVQYNPQEYRKKLDYLNYIMRDRDNLINYQLQLLGRPRHKYSPVVEEQLAKFNKRLNTNQAMMQQDQIPSTIKKRKFDEKVSTLLDSLSGTKRFQQPISQVNNEYEEKFRIQEMINNQLIEQQKQLSIQNIPQRQYNSILQDNNKVENLSSQEMLLHLDFVGEKAKDVYQQFVRTRKR